MVTAECSFQDCVDALIDRILVRVEKDVPVSGDFIPVTDFFENIDPGTQDIVGKYGLRVYKMPKDIVPDPQKRYVEAAAYEPNGYYKADMVVGSGSKQDIIELLKSDEFPLKLNVTYGELLDMFS